MDFRPDTPHGELAEYYRNFGYLIIRQFFDEGLIERANKEVEFALSRGREAFGRTNVDVLDADGGSRRIFLSELKDSDLKTPIKLNNIYLESPVMLELCRYGPLTRLLKVLIGGDPIVISSLNFILGSQQPVHNDSWYMPPPTKDKMAVASVCLDDVDDDNGPVFFYPSSHKLPPFILPHGGRKVMGKDDQQAVSQDADRRIREHGLEKQYFTGNQGDLLIWHAELLHGGLAIRDRSKSRRSLVTHYWQAQDLPDTEVAMVDGVPSHRLKKHGLSAVAARFNALRRLFKRL